MLLNEGLPCACILTRHAGEWPHLTIEISFKRTPCFLGRFAFSSILREIERERERRENSKPSQALRIPIYSRLALSPFFLLFPLSCPERGYSS